MTSKKKQGRTLEANLGNDPAHSAPRPDAVKTDSPLSATPGAPENLFQLFLHLVSRLGKWRLPILVCATLGGGALLVFSALPDATKRSILEHVVDLNPDEVKGAYYPGFAVDHNRQLVDLTEWTPATQSGDDQSCKVTWDYWARVRKIRNDIDYFAHRAATTGALPKFTSSTHEVSREDAPSQRTGGPTMKRYNVLLDVQSEVLDKVFDLHLRSVRLGGFKDPKAEWAATAVVQSTNEIVFEIHFPKDKPGRNFRFFKSPRIANSNYVPFIPEQSAVDESTQGVLKWTIDAPDLGYAYRVDWEW